MILMYHDRYMPCNMLQLYVCGMTLCLCSWRVTRGDADITQALCWQLGKLACYVANWASPSVCSRSVVGVAVGSMVSSSRVRLIWRHFVNNRMGEMASKAQMPTPETALPGRTDGLKVSGKTESSPPASFSMLTSASVAKLHNFMIQPR